MAALVLPTSPAPSSMEPRIITSRNEMAPSFAGPVQRQGRMGSRYALDYRMRPMTYNQAQEWADIDDDSSTVVMAIYQPGLDTGAPGSPVINGAGQSGSTVNLRGLTPFYEFRKNQWISMILGGQRFAYRVKAVTIVGSGGTVALPLRTLLRKPVTDGAVVEVAKPMIEGYPTPADGCWAIDATDRLIRLAFTIAERE